MASSSPASARSGKTAAENAACARLRGEVVVNSDASIRLHPAAIRRLVARLADPDVGVASGRDVSVAVAETSANDVEAGYVQYEMRLRSLETRTGGIVGASGCCYAIRADLHRLPIPPDLSRDFSAPLTAREHGYRAVSVDDAVAFVPRTPSLRREYVRKVRTISRGMETLFRVRAMMDPVRYGAFAWKLISHKVCRWLVPAGRSTRGGRIDCAGFQRVPGQRGSPLRPAPVPVAAVGALWPEGRRHATPDQRDRVRRRGKRRGDSCRRQAPPARETTRSGSRRAARSCRRRRDRYQPPLRNRMTGTVIDMMRRSSMTPWRRTYSRSNCTFCRTSSMHSS